MTPTYRSNPVKAIREKCIDCCGYMPSLVAVCEITECAIWPYRMGKNPFRAKRTLSVEKKEEMAARLAKARAK